MFNFSNFQLWIIVAVGLFALEAIAPGFFFATALALGAISAAAITPLNYGLEKEALFALASSILFFGLLRQIIASYNFSRNNSPKITTNTDALIGKDGVVTERITFPHSGRIRVGGELWKAQTHDHNDDLPINSLVTIVHIQGNTVIVRRKSNV